MSLYQQSIVWAVRLRPSLPLLGYSCIGVVRRIAIRYVHGVLSAGCKLEQVGHRFPQHNIFASVLHKTPKSLTRFPSNCPNPSTYDALSLIPRIALLLASFFLVASLH